MEPTCPQCHASVRPTDYFCANCGKNLRPKPLSTTPETLIMYYLGSIVLPPMGIIWGIKYYKDTNRTSKIHGIILMGITVVELAVLTIWTINLVHTVNTSVNQQINGLQGY